MWNNVEDVQKKVMKFTDFCANCTPAILDNCRMPYLHIQAIISYFLNIFSARISTRSKNTDQEIECTKICRKRKAEDVSILRLKMSVKLFR